MTVGDRTPQLIHQDDRSPPSSLSLRHFLPLGAVALLLRLVAAPWLAHEVDVRTFIAWGTHLATVGPAEFWNEGYWCDYLPGYLYVLWLMGEIASILPKEMTVFLLKLPIVTVDLANVMRLLLFKLPNIAADVATALLIWKLLRPTPAARKLWVPALYLFNPAIISNSTLWGQVDSFHAFFLVAGVALLCRRRPLWAAAVLGYAAAIKPHSVVLLPFALLHLVAARTAWWRTLLWPFLVVLVFSATFVPFNDWSISDLQAFIAGRIAATMDQYEHATVNALNLWYLLGKNWHADSESIIGALSVRQVGTAICVAGYALAGLWYLTRRRRGAMAALWQSTAIAYLITFLFVTRAHERHVFPYFAMVALLAGVQRSALLPYAIVSLTYCVNMVLAWRYILPAANSAELCPPQFAAIVCVVNLMALPLTFLSFTPVFDRWIRAAAKRVWALSRLEFEAHPPSMPCSPRLLLALIVLFAFGIRAFRLNVPDHRYFDEVYHAYTAEQWVRGNTDAWLWNTEVPDEGCGYEWTHPPLAKLLMAAAMKAFGIHPWVWRLPGALLGTLCVLLIYRIARVLFDNQAVALLAAALAALDSLPLVMSRIAMNDVYCVTFLLAAVLAALSGRSVRAALAIGLALACKWTALYGLPLLALVHQVRAAPGVRWRPGRLAKIAVAYAIIVPALYLGSYLPFFLAGHRWGQFVELQRQMWYYHTRLKATHAFASKAWQWPFTVGTVWCYTASSERHSPETPTATEHAMRTGSAASGGANVAETPPPEHRVIVSNVYAAGNPMIWLPGLGAVLLAVYQLGRRGDANLIVVVAGYLAFWAPWLASPRIMFLYHYLPSLPFLYIALAWSIVLVGTKRSGLVLIIGLAGLMLMIMYPYLAAVPMPENLAP